MSGTSSFAMLCALALGCLYLFNTVQAIPQDCCYNYSKKELPLKFIKGFTLQKSYEVCDIDAVIFITKKYRICANPSDQWVINALKELRTRRTKNVEKHLKKSTSSKN